MKKIISSLLIAIVVLIVLVMCLPSGNKKILNKQLKTHFETGINATFKMKDVDYKKYTEIMDYLNEHHDKAEDVLFEELAPKYNATAEE